MYASLSFAGFFPPAEVLGSYFFDGSAVWDIDIFSAINRCTEKGFKEQDIVVDMIMTSSANLKNVTADDYKSINMLFRYLEISSYYNSMDGYLRAKFAYPNVTFRHKISPSGKIPASLTPLAMNTKQIQAVFDMGFNDAKKQVSDLESGKGEAIDENFVHYYSLKQRGHPSIFNHTYGSFLDAKESG